MSEKDILSKAGLVRMVTPILVVDDADSTGWGEAVQIAQMTNLNLEVLGKNSASGTVKIYTSNQEEEPVWTDPVSETNRFSPIGHLNLDSQDVIAGSTGITVSDGLTQHLVSTQGARWLNLQVSALSAGKVSAWLTQLNNQ